MSWLQSAGFHDRVVFRFSTRLRLVAPQDKIVRIAKGTRGTLVGFHFNHGPVRHEGSTVSGVDIRIDRLGIVTLPERSASCIEPATGGAS